MYNKATLSEINKRFLGRHYSLMDSDVEMANRYVQHIEATRSKTQPKVGDSLRFTTKDGEYYERAHIEKIDENGAYICERAGQPFIGETEDGINCIASGGAWTYVPVEKLKYLGTRRKTFVDWGSCGACADGAVEFEASVSEWEYIAEGNPYITIEGHPYTTQHYNKWWITCNNDPHAVFSQPMKYKYRAIDEMRAWVDDEHFNAWLRTFRGRVFGDFDEGSAIVWTWRHQEHTVSPDRFEGLKLPEDTMLMNAHIMRCKREYDEEHHIVHTYFVWYWEEKGDHTEVALKQNEIREKYYYLPNNTPEYRLARTQIESRRRTTL